MNNTAPSATDPRLLLEAARVFNAAGPGYHTVAAVVAERALKAIAKADPDVHQAILGDAVALRLSGRVPGGCRASLDLLKDIRDVEEDDRDGRLHLLRALACGQMYRQERNAGKLASDAALDTLRRQIRQDLTFAFAQNERFTQKKTLKAENSGFWDPARSSLPLADRDLQAVWEDDPAFQKLVDQHVPRAGPTAPPAGPVAPPAASTAPPAAETEM